MNVDGEQLESPLGLPFCNEGLARGVPCTVCRVDATWIVAVELKSELSTSVKRRICQTYLSVGNPKLPFTSTLSKAPPAGAPVTRLSFSGLYLQCTERQRM